MIIGAGPGIGAAVARKFSSEGYRVTIAARGGERLESLANDLRVSGGVVDVLTVDAAEPEALRSAVLESAASGSPAVLVYNAAMLTPTSLTNVSTEQLLTGYSVDVVSAIAATQAVLPAMREARQGTVIFTGGSAAVRPSPGIATVSLGKAALRSAATMLAADVNDDNVHVVSVTVSGAVKPGTAFDPNSIADTYWRLHEQPRAQWTSEEPFLGAPSP
jgi:short-subunit dehydrogenase